MNLILCIACGHPWIYHERGGCDELIELDSQDGMEVCGCEHTCLCEGCRLTAAPPAARPAGGAQK